MAICQIYLELTIMPAFGMEILSYACDS